MCINEILLLSSKFIILLLLFIEYSMFSFEKHIYKLIDVKINGIDKNNIEKNKFE